MSIFSTVAGFATSSATSLVNPLSLGKFKLIAIGLLVGAAIIALIALKMHLHSLHSQIDDLQKEKTTLVANNKILQENVDIVKNNVKALSDVNFENAKTIEALKSERDQSKKAIEKLASSNLNSKKIITDLNKKLDDIIKDPANDGPVAPALRETVRNIQNTRAQ